MKSPTTLASAVFRRPADFSLFLRHTTQFQSDCPAFFSRPAKPSGKYSVNALFSGTCSFYLIRPFFFFHRVCGQPSLAAVPKLSPRSSILVSYQSSIRLFPPALMLRSAVDTTTQLLGSWPPSPALQNGSHIPSKSRVKSFSQTKWMELILPPNSSVPQLLWISFSSSSVG